jgi:outer membrane scaffolding protein for murein synthesis (MipA/OmpV family)
MRLRHLVIAAGFSLAPGIVSAGDLLDYLRNYDLNNYALGVAVSTAQNPYIGAKNSTIAYPYLTSFRHSAFTDDWLLVRDGGAGFRWVSDSGWELGAIGRIQTLGLGNAETDELLGITDRKWTLEFGPTIGWRRWPVHINWTSYVEPTDRHDGIVSYLSLSLPKEWSRGYFVPSIDVIHQSQDYVNYYYEVAASEATPTRPVYAPDDATNVALSIDWGYALTDKWLLKGYVGYESLPSEITSSPIVDRDHIWSANIGLAYNADVFQPREVNDRPENQQRFEIKIGAFHNLISSKVARDTVDGTPGFEIDIEDLLGAPDLETVPQIEAVIRLGHYHRIEFGYFELLRDSVTTLTDELVFGDETFAAGTTVNARINAKVFRAGYAYSLIRDKQKELGFMVGLHHTRFDTQIASSASGQRERSSANAPLPVIGAHASVAITEKTTVSAKLQFFRTDFDRHEGTVNYASIDVQRQIGGGFSVGLGYNFYGMKLTSNDSDVNGYLKVRHHGPVLFFSTRH